MGGNNSKRSSLEDLLIHDGLYDKLKAAETYMARSAYERAQKKLNLFKALKVTTVLTIFGAAGYFGMTYKDTVKEYAGASRMMCSEYAGKAYNACAKYAGITYDVCAGVVSDLVHGDLFTFQKTSSNNQQGPVYTPVYGDPNLTYTGTNTDGSRYNFKPRAYFTDSGGMTYVEDQNGKKYSVPKGIGYGGGSFNSGDYGNSRDISNPGGYTGDSAAGPTDYGSGVGYTDTGETHSAPKIKTPTPIPLADSKTLKSLFPVGDGVVYFGDEDNGESRNAIYISKSDGKTKVKLAAVSSDADSESLRLSSDKRKILYLDEQKLYVIDANGKRCLVNKNIYISDKSGAEWFPDSSRIVYVNLQDGNPEIYSIYADGTKKKRLTFNPAADYDPSFKDGKIHFESERDGGSMKSADGECFDQYVMNQDGSDQKPDNDSRWKELRKCDCSGLSERKNSSSPATLEQKVENNEDTQQNDSEVKDNEVANVDSNGNVNYGGDNYSNNTDSNCSGPCQKECAMGYWIRYENGTEHREDNVLMDIHTNMPVTNECIPDEGCELIMCVKTGENSFMRTGETRYIRRTYH